jgi:transcriptional regulator with XRE-family HTH domain
MALTEADPRREELRAFLRSRRARLTPADVGLPDGGGRRRTPGLRREELAQLAGVGVSWYTWLEQGRDINASPQVLDALAVALRLDPAERNMLYALARTELPLAPASDDQDGEAELVALVHGLHPHPAYLLGPLTRVLAWNAAAAAVLTPMDHLPHEHRTLLYRCFVDVPPAERSPQMQTTAVNVLARFRAEYARHAGEPAYEAHLALLRERSEDFAGTWEAGEVSETQRGLKTIEHPALGTLRLHHAQTVPTGAPELRLSVYAPADAATRAALDSRR